MAAQYVLVYATLRTAIRSQALVIAAVVAAVMGNIFANLGAYAGYPQHRTAALRAPVPGRGRGSRRRALAAARAGAAGRTACSSSQSPRCGVSRRPCTRASRGSRWRPAGLRAVEGGPAGVRAGLAAAAAVSVGAVLALTIGTRIVAGVWPDWGGYFAYHPSVFGRGVRHPSPRLLVARPADGSRNLPVRGRRRVRGPRRAVPDLRTRACRTCRVYRLHRVHLHVLPGPFASEQPPEPARAHLRPGLSLGERFSRATGTGPSRLALGTGRIPARHHGVADCLQRPRRRAQVVPDGLRSGRAFRRRPRARPRRAVAAHLARGPLGGTDPRRQRRRR